MTDVGFQFEDCLLKHYIRLNAWLPRCRERLNAIRRAVTGTRHSPRRLKYFTFCAIGALDVLLLDRAKVIRRSTAHEFDSVVFFDRNAEAILETRKRIPGAIGFPGDFINVILQDFEDDEAKTDELESPANEENTAAVRGTQIIRAQFKNFRSTFPFDVINLDVEQYLFRPSEELPGKLMLAMRKIFEWQKLEGIDTSEKKYNVDEFTLMFTTQIGPKDLPEDYLTYLRDTCLQSNLDTYPELKDPYLKKAKGMDVQAFFSNDFDGAFKLAVPKSLIELAFEQDWHVDGNKGIEVFQFDRAFKGGSYRMLHMAMTVHRQKPAKHKRGPGQKPPVKAANEHKESIKLLFNSEVTVVESQVTGANKTKIAADLENLFEHRKKYLPKQ